MKKYIVTRTAKTERGTYGTIREQFLEPFAVTYELPWRGNKKNISCIPPGKYFAERAVYGVSKIKKKQYESFIILDVPRRSGIFLHVGNSIQDSRGCILLGESFDPVFIKGRKIAPGILSSKKGFRDFMGSIGKAKQIELEILEAPHA